jgi:cell wall assembly regulator SMI1
MSMWIELAGAAYPEVETGLPASGTAIDEIVRRLDARVPADLRALLLESDGLRGKHLVDVVWPAERIAADNADFRTDSDFAELYQPFDGLLFFGDNGGADQFAYLPEEPAAGIFVWEHETDDRRRVAENLADYLRQILTSEGDAWYENYSEWRG